jgi:putative membrane protein
MSLSDLPAVNACLNGASTIFLTIGYIHIKKGRQNAHRNCMVAALVTSSLFLTCYLIYHYNTGRTTFQDPQWFRPYYLLLLLTHTVLAVAIVPMVAVTVIHALRKKWDSHKRLARWTWPIWMYVSVTGVLIYLLLYQIFPQQPERPAPAKSYSAAS